MKKIVVFGLVAAFMFTTNSCKKDKFELPETQSTSEFYQNTSTFEVQLTGRILDTDGTAIQGATVSVGSSSYTSNAEGLYSIISNSGSENGTIITVSATGYEPTSIVAYSNSASPKSFKEIVLITKNVSATFNGNDGGTVSSQGVEIDFAKKSIVDADQNLYEGNVNVNIQYLDPSGSISNAIPGGSLGLDAEGNQKFLANHGTAMVKLTGENGEALNIKEGKTAEIKIPLGNLSTSISESSIAMWSYDEQNHYWIQEGFAEKEGTMMVANVRHFSWWSCSSPYDPTNLVVNFECGGDPIVGHAVLTTANGSFIGSQGSNSLGWVAGPAPLGISMILSYNEPVCGEEIYSGSIGPLTGGYTYIGPLSACPNITVATFEGYLKDCNDQPLAGGLVLIVAHNGGGVILTSDASGYYSGSMVDCGTNSIEITAYDMTNLLQSTSATYSFQTTNDFAIISVCNSLDEYFHYSLDGDWISEYDVDNGNTIAIYFNNPGVVLSCAISNDYQMSLSSDGEGIGTHIITGGLINDVSFSNTTSIYVTFSLYSSVAGEFIEGTMSGTDNGTDGFPHTLGGNFRIKVD